jgi:type VI secretion system protein ImpL
VLSARIPYFFTRAGFEKTYTIGLATVQQDLQRDLWVLGSNAQTGGVKEEMGDLRAGVAGRYAKDYIAAWDNLVKALAPANYFNNPAAFGAMTKSPSPLKRVLMELRKNTIFAGGVQAAGKRMFQQKLNTVRGSTYLREMGNGRAQGLDAGDEITNYFQPVQDYVGDGKQPGPIDDFIGALKSAGEAVIAAKSVGGGGGSDATQAAMATALAQVKAAATGAPPQLQDFVNTAAGGGATAQVEAAKGAVADAYTQSVLPVCKGVADEHYPFFGTATADAATVDVLRVFGMGGVIDGFVQQRLKPLLETDGPVWRWKTGDPLAAALDPGSPEQLSKAAEVRDLLAGGLPLKVSLVRLGPGVGSVEISSGGSTYRFSTPSDPAKPLLWSISGGLPQASVTLFKAGASAPAAAAAPDAQLKQIQTDGPWALFKLVDKGTKENAGPQAIKVTFGDGGATATFLFQLPNDKNPFSRGGLWSFRCPRAL